MVGPPQKNCDMRLLIVHPGGVGDVLLALPALRSLRRRHGADEVGLLAARQVGELLRNCHEIDTVFALESGGLAELLSGEASDTSPFLTWLKGCESAQCWMADRNGELRAAFTAQGVRDIAISSPMAGPWNGCHQSDRYLDTAACRRFEPEADGPLRVTKVMEAGGRSALDKAGVPYHRPYVVIHPGSGSIHKCCQPSVLSAVLDWVMGKELIPLIVEGPADARQVGKLIAQWPRSLCLLKGCDLSELAGIIQNALLYVGHDSGITHLAAALAVPTVACFGPTNEARWGPRARSVMVVRGAACRCVTWDAVQQCREKPCLTIPSSAMVNACENLLQKSQQKP